MDVLSQFTNDGADEFVTERPTEPFHARVSQPGELFSLSRIDDLLESGAVQYPMMTMARNGQRISPDLYSWAGKYRVLGHQNRIRASGVADQLSRGSSLIVEALHLLDSEVGLVAAELERKCGTYVTACAFLAPATSQGLDHHHDTHDAFIVQVDGSKHWELYKPIVAQPLIGQDFEGADAYPDLQARLEGPPDSSFVMEPGDVLFLPRGWIHNPFSTDGYSLHLNFALHPRPRGWVLAQIVESFARSSWARQEMQRSTGSLLCSSDDLRDLGAVFVRWLDDNSESLVSDLSPLFYAGRPETSMRAVEAAFCLPLKMTDDLQLVGGSIRQVARGDSGMEVLLIDGPKFAVPKFLEPVFALWRPASDITFSMAEIAKGDRDDEVLGACGELVLLGVARLISRAK